MVLERIEKRFGLPPITDVTKFLSGENGKQINSILSKLEKLSSNQYAIRDAIELLRLVRELGQSGDLERLDSILKNIPKGKSGENIIVEVRKLITELSDKLDKIGNLAQSILAKED